ncbi:acyltransferase [Thalassotalea mangrovi]|uniref:Acyltransferase n=1 Tax=Thalassotalea mangrovi TaxID=2572245 RepID=A0A4U1B822_9GAMM|nr:DapH/DapD/GlmU-related protein [Thalassotalea mangrovi]TKB46142.1 hypothetical protein E8M12_05815 [Thalassotalea mangrovi]
MKLFVAAKRRINSFYWKHVLGGCGENCVVDTDVDIYNAHNVFFGNNVTVNTRAIIQSCGNSVIRLGNNVVVSYGSMILTGNLDFIQLKGGHNTTNVTIGDNTWIGANAIILPGVVIGSGSVIAAGSIVTKNVGNNVIVAGNPAKVIKDINRKSS